MRTTYWQKLEDAKKKGLTAEQLSEIEALEAAIAYHEGEIDKCRREIKRIEGKERPKNKKIKLNNEPAF